MTDWADSNGSRLEKTARICRKYGVVLLYFFGSRADEGLNFINGKPITLHDALADLDVGVVTGEPLPPPLERTRLYAGLYNELDDLLQPFQLDLVRDIHEFVKQIRDFITVK